MNVSRQVQTQSPEITEQATQLKKGLLPQSFFDLLDFDWFGCWGPWLQSALQALGIILLIIIIAISLASYTLSETLKACSQPLTTKQMSPLRLECQERTLENNQVKTGEPEAMTREYPLTSPSPAKVST